MGYGTHYAFLNLRLKLLWVASVMNLRLVGMEPLVGVTLHHQSHGVDPISDAPCETCGQCGKPIPARNIYFDGNRFLCAGCRKQRLISPDRVTA